MDIVQLLFKLIPLVLLIDPFPGSDASSSGRSRRPRGDTYQRLRSDTGSPNIPNAAENPQVYYGYSPEGHAPLEQPQGCYEYASEQYRNSHAHQTVDYDSLLPQMRNLRFNINPNDESAQEFGAPRGGQPRPIKSRNPRSLQGTVGQSVPQTAGSSGSSGSNANPDEGRLRQELAEFGYESRMIELYLTERRSVIAQHDRAKCWPDCLKWEQKEPKIYERLADVERKLLENPLENNRDRYTQELWLLFERAGINSSLVQLFMAGRRTITMRSESQIYMNQDQSKRLAQTPGTSRASGSLNRMKKKLENFPPKGI